MTFSNQSPKKPLRSLFPTEVITEESVITEINDSLYPEEMYCISNAANKRKSEFTAGRVCARNALKKLGYTDFPLLMGEDRAPQWPEDISGSIAHTSEYCGVAVARKKDFPSLGFDMELIDRLGKHLWPQIFTSREQSWIQTLPSDQQDRSATLLFSAKECFYKYQYPLTKLWVGFEDVEIEASLVEDEFKIYLLKDVPPLGKIKTTFSGHFLYHSNHVFTVIF